MTKVKWLAGRASEPTGVRTPEMQNPREPSSRGQKHSALGAGYSRATPNSCISQTNIVTKLP